MSIDLFSETILSLREAAKAVPSIDGRKPAYGCIWRWCHRGIRGIRLEHVKLGGKLATSKEALQRFFSKLTELETSDSKGSLPRRAAQAAHSKQRLDSISRAEQELDARNVRGSKEADS